MQCRTYQSRSLEESSGILNREWSRHRVALPNPSEDVRLRFSIRPLGAHTSLSSLAYGASVLVQPEERAKVLLLQMPRAGSGLVSYGWGQSPLDARRYALIDVQQVAQVHYGAQLDMLVLRIGVPRLMEQLASLLGRMPKEDIVFAPHLVQGSASWDAWAPVAAALEALQRNPQADIPGQSLAALENLALTTLLLAQPSNYLDELRRPRRAAAPRQVRAAEEFIHANLHRALATEEIARHAGVSVRALFDAFREFRNATPAAYARRARLEGARRELEQGTHCIAEVAGRWGFPHAGHFAAQYRRHFGESPAQTARLH